MSVAAARRTGALLLVGAVAATASGCGALGPRFESASASTPVVLRAQDAPSLTVGVIVSLGSDLGQGADWNRSAEGTQVAAHRYRLGGLKVLIRPEDDKGTAAGARAAVRRLVKAHVSGIVLASEGDHVRPALLEAERDGVPVLIPYATATSDLPDTTWSTGPDADQLGTTLADALVAQDLRRPLLVDAGGGAVQHVAPVERLPFRADGDAEALARAVSSRVRSHDIDAVMVSGPAELQGQVVAALQGSGAAVPLFLTPQALSPAFTTALDRADGSLDVELTSVGTPGGDTTTLQAGSAGRAASAFYAALRSAAAGSSLRSFFDGQPFATVAADADSRSHDAVVALVTAAGAARSGEPRDVRAALAHLVVTSRDGLAGPDLDFRHQSALGSGGVTTLRATTQDPGVKPAAPGPQIHWFPTALP